MFLIMPLDEFAAAQAAQKYIGAWVDSFWAFAAAQAAQKFVRVAMFLFLKFAAAQAAQKMPIPS